MPNQTQSENNVVVKSYHPHLMSLTDLLKRSWSYLWEHWRVLLSISVIIFLPSILQQLYDELVRGQTGSVIVIVNLILGFISIIVSLWGTLAFIAYFKNESLTASQAFRQGLHFLLAYLLVAILGSVIVIIGLILLIIPGVVAGVYLSLLAYVLMAEEKRGRAALKRSLELVKGYWWAVFGRQLLLALIFFLLSFASTPFVIIPKIGILLSGLIFVLLYILAVPFAVFYTWQIYLNLKEIKENLRT